MPAGEQQLCDRTTTATDAADADKHEHDEGTPSTSPDVLKRSDIWPFSSGDRPFPSSELCLFPSAPPLPASGAAPTQQKLREGDDGAVTPAQEADTAVHEFLFGKKQQGNTALGLMSAMRQYSLDEVEVCS
jgi:hypothetical protein